MEACAHLEPDREHVRHGAAADRQNQGLPVTRHCAGPSAVPDRVSSEIGAKACWPLWVFKLAKSAERHWRKLDGANRLGQLIEGVKFRNASPFKMPRTKPPPDPVHQD